MGNYIHIPVIDTLIAQAMKYIIVLESKNLHAKLQIENYENVTSGCAENTFTHGLCQVKKYLWL